MVVLATLVLAVVLAAMVAGVPVGMGAAPGAYSTGSAHGGSALLALLASRPDRRAAAV